MDTSTLATWATFSAVIIGAIISVVRPDNKALPFSISPSKRAMLAVVLGALQASLMAVASGTPWMQAVGTAIVSVVAAFAAHGAPRVIPVAGLLLCLTVGATSGCALLTPKRLHGIEDITRCVLEHRSMSPEDVAKECAVDDAQDVVDIIAGADRRAAAAREVGCK